MQLQSIAQRVYTIICQPIVEACKRAGVILFEAPTESILNKSQAVIGVFAYQEQEQRLLELWTLRFSFSQPGNKSTATETKQINLSGSFEDIQSEDRFYSNLKYIRKCCQFGCDDILHTAISIQFCNNSQDIGKVRALVNLISKLQCCQWANKHFNISVTMKHCYEGRRDCQTDQQKKLEQIDKCKEGQENKNHGNCQGSDEEFEVMIDQSYERDKKQQEQGNSDVRGNEQRKHSGDQPSKPDTRKLSENAIDESHRQLRKQCAENEEQHCLQLEDNVDPLKVNLAKLMALLSQVDFNKVAGVTLRQFIDDRVVPVISK